MASKLELQGVFGSLVDTLNRRFNPFWPDEVGGAWLAAMGRANAIGDPGKWNRLPSADPAYDRTITEMNVAAARFVVGTDAGSHADIVQGLRAISQALGGLGHLIDDLAR